MEKYKQRLMDLVKQSIEIAGSQRALCRFLDTDPAAICKWVSGDTSPRGYFVLAMQDFCNDQAVQELAKSKEILQAAGRLHKKGAKNGTCEY